MPNNASEGQQELYNSTGRTDHNITFLDMREDCYPIMGLAVYTKDAIPLNVSVFLVYNFLDAKKCFYEVDNLSVAIYNTV